MIRRLARVLAYVGPVAVVVGLSKVHAAWIAEPPYDYTGSFRFAWSLVYCALQVVTAYGAGLPDLARSTRDAFFTAIAAAFAAAVAISAVQLVTGDALLPRFVVFGTVVVLVPWHTALSALARRGTTLEADRDRVVLVAGPRQVDALARERAWVPERPWVLAAAIDPAEVQGGDDGGSPLVALAHRHGATVVVLGRAALLDRATVAQAAELHEHGVRVRSLRQFYEEWLGKLPLDELVRESLFFDIAELHRRRYARVKRLIDVCGGLGLMVPLVLATPVVLVGNLVANRGPLLYGQDRVGHRGRTFRILKFRTMRPATSGEGDGRWTTQDDPRVTPFGRFLRRAHLDELPQAVNILRGDLSIVGPRPEQPRYVSALSSRLPFYDLRHLVRPGLTGWAQVKYGYAGDERDALEKLQYEFFYLQHQGPRLDTQVLVRTTRSVLGSEGVGR